MLSSVDFMLSLSPPVASSVGFLHSKSSAVSRSCQPLVSSYYTQLNRKCKQQIVHKSDISFATNFYSKVSFLIDRHSERITPESDVGVIRSAMATGDATETSATWRDLEGKLGPDKAERLPSVKKRIFEDGQEPALIFYRDNSSWCPYCERVWLQLEEKKISYQVEKINMRCYGEKPAWFMKMVPSGLLPVLEVDGKILTESMDIMFLIEQNFPKNTSLLPAKGTPELAAVEGLLRLERSLAGAWLNRLRSSWPDMNGFENTMDKVNSALKKFGGPYFLGRQVSVPQPF